jgi:hypothetical protein
MNSDCYIKEKHLSIEEYIEECGEFPVIFFTVEQV